jgi:hypothetical protein
MDLAHRKRRRDDEPGVAPPGEIITIEEWAHQYGWHPREREESVARARVQQLRERLSQLRDDEVAWVGKELYEAGKELQRLKYDRIGQIRVLKQDADLYGPANERVILPSVSQIAADLSEPGAELVVYLKGLVPPVVRLAKRQPAFVVLRN